MVQKRLQTIDMYRHLENTMALGTTDEYDIKNLSLSGIKDLLEKFQDALSASTCIPSTVLFGRSPAGMSATGESDLENYYNMVDRIRNRTLKPNLMRLVYILSLASDYGIKLPEQWNIQFKPLWNASEKEVAEVQKLEAESLAQRANAAKTYRDMGALDGKEVRSTLLETKDFIMDASLDAALLRTPEGE
jgi:phage-related protein (TIGR01555 family)